MNFEIKMPDLSTTGSPINIIRWLVAVGEFVERGQALAVLGAVPVKAKPELQIARLGRGHVLIAVGPVGQLAQIACVQRGVKMIGVGDVRQRRAWRSVAVGTMDRIPIGLA